MHPGAPVTSGLDLTREEAKLDRQTRFLQGYTEAGTISGACRIAGISHQTHRNWLVEEDGDYKQRFRDAHEAMIDAAEEELRRRGVEGVDKTIWWQGIPCGTEKQYSDTCLLFYLKGRRGEVFRERDAAPTNVLTAVTIYLPANERSEEIIEGEVTQVTLLDNKRDE